MRDAHPLLLRALTRRWPALHPLDSASEPWASITFSGTRHLYVFATGPDLAGIAAEEWALPGHVVADIAAVIQGERLIVEALTLETAAA